ncbi:MAG: hypothetical protein GY725_00005 [bacterium]|nr:hypothetical protein [bacterium]
MSAALSRRKVQKTTDSGDRSHRQCWGEDRVFYLDEGEGLRSIPARWTSMCGDDPLVVISDGRSMYRVGDLLELVKLARKTER